MDLSRIEVIDDVMCDVLKKKTALERLKIGFGLWHSAKTILYHTLKSTHPDWDEEKIREETARRISHGAA